MRAIMQLIVLICFAFGLWRLADFHFHSVFLTPDERMAYAQAAVVQFYAALAVTVSAFVMLVVSFLYGLSSNVDPVQALVSEVKAREPQQRRVRVFVRKLIEDGWTVEEIANKTNLPPDEIREAYVKK